MAEAIRNHNASYLHPSLATFLERASTIVVNKDRAMKLAWTCILAGGHLLIEDRPGMGKTTMVKVIARLLNLPWKRIQCTNDLLPADITGGNIYDPAKSGFVFHAGPLFSHLVMADELNRASPKSQSAFLQAMEEGNVTVDGETYALPKPFVMIATQNSLDSVGTNPLPESQLDRFMMSISLGLPGRDGEKQLLMNTTRAESIEALVPVLNAADLLRLRAEVNTIHVSERVATYILDIADAIRSQAEGLSPRSALALTIAAKAWAYGHQRSFVMPDDVKEVIDSVLAHRLVAKVTSNKTISGLIQETLRAIVAP